MKNELFTVCLSTALALGLFSCEDDKVSVQDIEHSNDIVVNTNKVWDASELPAYIGDISYLPTELQDIIRERFSDEVGVDRANIIFAGHRDLENQFDVLHDAAADGKFVVIPGDADYTQLGMDVRPVMAPVGAGEIAPLFYCYTGWGGGQLYVMYDEAVSTSGEEGTPSLSDEEWYELNEKDMAEGEEDDEDDFYATTDYDNHSAQNENYYQTRIDPFVEWVDNCFLERSLVFSRSANYDHLKVDIEKEGQLLAYNFPFSLNNFIDKATLSKPDSLCKSGSITVEFNIYPIYMNSSNGEKAGDYYGVVSTVTPHNESLWGPYSSAHGKTRLRIYGYWFSEMEVETSLTHLDGSEIKGLSYFERPIPENKNNSKSYSNGKNFSMTGAVTGGKAAGKTTLTGQLSMGGTWTSSTNYSLETINFTMDSSTPTVKYHYWGENVALKDDWGNWEKIHRNFPSPIRSEFSAHSMWVWHVPADAAKDYSDHNFKLNTKIKLGYSSWHHWRATLNFDSNRKDYVVNVPAQSWELEHPDRTPWGFICLRNAADKEMAHVTFYDAEKESTEPVAQLTTSFGKGQEAKIALAEGTYNVTWDIVDGNTGAKVSSWIYKNVKVVKGQNENAATTRISSVDGTKVK